MTARPDTQRTMTGRPQKGCLHAKEAHLEGPAAALSCLAACSLLLPLGSLPMPAAVPVPVPVPTVLVLTLALGADFGDGGDLCRQHTRFTAKRVEELAWY